MAVGDMKYKFTDNNGDLQEVNVPAAVLRSGKRQGLSNKETIMKYAFENGYAVDAPVLPEKKPRKFTRKPDTQKQKIIETIAAALEDDGKVTILNEERQIQIEINNDLFEITLVKKRKPKTE